MSSLDVFFCFVLWLAVGAGVWLKVRHERRRRLERLAAVWEQFQDTVRLTDDADVCQVASVYQRAHHGDKAVIVWATGTQQDSWFEGQRVFPGMALLVRGSTGYGPHNNNPNVFYVHPSEVVATAPPGAYQAWVKVTQAPTR